MKLTDSDIIDLPDLPLMLKWAGDQAWHEFTVTDLVNHAEVVCPCRPGHIGRLVADAPPGCGEFVKRLHTPEILATVSLGHVAYVKCPDGENRVAVFGQCPRCGRVLWAQRLWNPAVDGEWT